MSNWPEWVLEEMEHRGVDDGMGNPFCNKKDWHHCIVPKSVVRGMPDEERAKINRPWNIIVIDSAVHLWKPVPERYEAALWMYEHHPEYDREVIRKWFYNEINWKNRPFELP